MTTFVAYLLKLTLCSGVLYSYYHFALRNKLYHQWNRFYLLASLLLSLTLPLIHIEWQHTEKTEPVAVQILTVVSNANNMIEEAQVPHAAGTDYRYWLWMAYALISCILFILFVQSLVYISRIIRKEKVVKLNSVKFLETDAKGTPFSFLHYIFWNRNISLDTETGQQILRHEMVHVASRHTVDKLLFQLAIIIFWCNPFFWLMRREITMLHEFIADEKAVGHEGTGAFAAMILQAAYPQQYQSIVNHFFQKSIKRRINMLNKIQSRRLGYFSRIAVLPLAAFTIFAFTVKSKTVAGLNDLDKPITVVIDAGHGIQDGKHNGATSGAFYEDDLVFSLAQKIKAMNTNKNIKIVFTRNNDQFVSLKDRVETAATAKADLFISLHMDAVANETNADSSGLTVFIPKNESFRKNSEVFGSMLVQQLGSLYPMKHVLNTANMNVYVLEKNICPAVLIECGYVTATNDRNLISSGKKQELIAQKILTAIAQYAANNGQATGMIKSIKRTENDSMLVSSSGNPSVLNIKGHIVMKLNSLALTKKDALVLVNGNRLDVSSKKELTITAESLLSYEANNEEAIRKYGSEAVNGVLVFSDAIVSTGKK